ncbi:hypothetical protein GCM10010261_41510 [Streptomyces pilosus]|uniref:sigma factor-like helix-turn-helix DNA-binding protein n=1 Tax=Streptomyces pilosus TaxID=28893 RepID=UPI00167215A2|nr:sigma factor-like helix-turn-helix DNA-binding protein [Streptomyces pilosus]GGV56388.1 hypothetical protein GCM10010261_41510 [Streptomyces pilosus]
MNTGTGIHRPGVRVGAHRRGAAVAGVRYVPLRPVRQPAGDDGFTAYARGRWPGLVATSLLLTEDAGAAEELARRTLVRVCARWRRIPRDDVDFHVRRCLLRVHLRARRAGARRRAVLVLRYWSGLREPEIAQVLGCSVGAVRAVVRRGAKELQPGLRQAGFAAALDGFVPPALPLAEIRAAGALRRRRRAGVVAAGCALLLAPPAVYALAPGEVPAGAAGASPGRPEPGPVRVVAPGERVSAAPGVDVWLTADGHHWSSPRSPARFRAVDDGNLDRSRPGVSLQGERLDDGTYVRTGVFHGLAGDPARVEVREGGRTVTADVLTLAGSPGWGAWYVRTAGGDAEAAGDTAAQAVPGAGGPAVTVYDAAGKVLVRAEFESAAVRAVPVGSWRR